MGGRRCDSRDGLPTAQAVALLPSLVFRAASPVKGGVLPRRRRGLPLDRARRLGRFPCKRSRGGVEPSNSPRGAVEMDIGEA